MSIPRRRCSGILRLMELIFEIRDAEEGGLYARALGQGIFTEAESWDETSCQFDRGSVLTF